MASLGGKRRVDRTMEARCLAKRRFWRPTVVAAASEALFDPALIPGDRIIRSEKCKWAVGSLPPPPLPACVRGLCSSRVRVKPLSFTSEFKRRWNLTCFDVLSNTREILSFKPRLVYPRYWHLVTPIPNSQIFRGCLTFPD